MGDAASPVVGRLDFHPASTANVRPMTMVPNHHAGQDHFSGVGGLLHGLTMTVGRGSSSRLASRLGRAGPDDHVVDVGCGPGSAARHAARLGARVTAIDPAAVMLRLARRLTSSGRVMYLEGAAEALPLTDGTATVLWSIASVHHWTDVDAGLREARRVLRPGGRLVAVERRIRPGATGLASHGWTDDQAATFAAACGAAGFAGARTEHTGGGRGGVVAVVAAVPAGRV
jgi:ubiquinone/menaquinone biosynthesis C-methylase UbiE